MKAITLGAGVRWRIARILNCLPWTCWSELVLWAMDIDGTNQRALRPCFAVGECKRDRDEPSLGVCYCGKFASPQVRAVWAQARAREEGATP